MERAEITNLSNLWRGDNPSTLNKSELALKELFASEVPGWQEVDSRCAVWFQTYRNRQAYKDVSKDVRQAQEDSSTANRGVVEFLRGLLCVLALS